MANKIYTAIETALLFADAAQAEDATLTLSALGSGVGRVSARFDRGAGSHAGLYEWRLNWSLTGTNVVAATVEIYLASSDGTNPDGQIGTADAALATDKRKNLKLAGLAIVDQTTTNTVMTASGYIWVPSRYISMAVWNATTLAFQTSTSLHQLYLTPVPDEIQ